ncbi:MAG: 16S rRNA (guanine(527)-N(7))-methyltransferase RsmG [Ignavibacteriales bacterium]|nr:16S rRNA (guanine(527)-N(7))-methyltransferase RsmG [Ignavibacteriales bacterium]MCF8317003.1 16S rRNA (guanine(527)-N(7))-methyltransferase RsmG [Ignavibacteriales bacterium]MCF8438601.1 16S rRNA (guanine(527)-N(7))-methyltransferase RsmG [Ignavibacteriales bacterium]
MDDQEKYLRELKKLFWENNISVDEFQLERLAHFAELVVGKNEDVNLISRNDIENIAENHIFISYLVSQYIPLKALNFLDIGTGGGFPGIPLAISNPMFRGVLADSTGKKIEAVQDFLSALKLTNVVAENSRVESEEFKEKYKDHFDVVVSRATVPLIILFRYSVPLIKNKAYLLAMKGGDITEEFQTASLKYKPYIKKSTIFELSYKPGNIRNEKGKKLVLVELVK